MFSLYKGKSWYFALALVECYVSSVITHFEFNMAILKQGLMTLNKSYLERKNLHFLTRDPDILWSKDDVKS